MRLDPGHSWTPAIARIGGKFDLKRYHLSHNVGVTVYVKDYIVADI